MRFNGAAQNTPTSSPRSTPSREGTPGRRPPHPPPVFSFDELNSSLGSLSVSSVVDEEGSSTTPLRRNSLMGQQLSVLKKEMAKLRQMDMQLLCHLWSVHERIQDLRQSLSESNCSNISDSDYYNSFDFDEADETDYEENVYDEPAATESEAIVNDSSSPFDIRTCTMRQTSL
ncbi:uncharacterized protein LOC136029569 [Artemia franciscana]